MPWAGSSAPQTLRAIPPLYQYEALGRFTESIDSLNQRTQQTWNAHDTVVTVTDAKGNPHRYFYDKTGRRTEACSPDNAACEGLSDPRRSSVSSWGTCGSY